MTIYKKNGKFYSRFKIHGEQRHFLCQGAMTQSQAQAIEDAEKFKLRQQQAGLIKKECSITVHRALDKFAIYSENNKKSYETDKCRIKILKDIIPDSLLVVKTKPDYIEHLKMKLKDRGLSTTTVNKYLALLSKAFGLLVKNRDIEYNPVSEVKYFKKTHHKVRYLTKEEEGRLFDNLPEYMQDIVNTALYTGQRKENIVSLRWEQVDFKLKNIEILDNKGNKHIILPIVKPLEKILKKLKALNYSDEYVFANPQTGSRYYEIDRCWRDCRDKAGLSDFRFHDLRHTVGTRLAEQGVPVNVIQEILAHSDVRTTMKYIHLVEGSKRAALESIL